ncbi:hypothetical protein [Tannerella sp.]|uniref:hypothetical protein n=1 Tax=Tannerella sp. TaxID=2382127 RepID=UPI0026DB3157|nr:hypothetical protein [Tannerella sp.]MDO4703663.1 hypothetical protein [Tannerella sp.]
MNVSALSPVDWQNVVNAVPSLCWGVIGLMTFVFLLRVLSPIIELRIRNSHEIKMKKKAFKMEKYWHFIKKVDVASDETLQKENIELKQKIKKMEEEKISIEANSKSKITLLEHDIELYKKIVDGLSVTLDPTNLKTKK